MTVSSSISTPTAAGQSTCPSRTINYITQTLPQQCLTSSWSSKPASLSVTAINASSSPDALASLLAANALEPKLFNASQAKPDVTSSLSSHTSTVSDTNDHQTFQPRAKAEPSKEADPVEEPNQEDDPDSPLDKANFLSFEEWKHQNLAKAGQSAENLASRDGGGKIKHGGRLGEMNSALESLGEDSEIEIDFSGFGNAGSMNDALPVQSALSRSSATEGQDVVEEKIEDPSSPHRRSKDAGKTCKERSNYASFDCAATALKANPECKSTTSVLVESKDSYMLNVCSAKNKFFIVELCDDILIDTVVLANFEYFSSMFRTFRVSVSDRYPVKMDKWKDLGTFEARNSREIQSFLVVNPLIWARYLRIEFLTHYGAEYYCPVSLLRVHGTTMMEEFNHEVKGARGEDEVEPETGGSDVEAIAQKIDVVSTDVLETAPQAASERENSTQDDSRVSSTLDGFTPYRSSIGEALEDMSSCMEDREGHCSYIHQSEDTRSTSTSLPSTAYESELSVKAVETSTDRLDVKKAFQKTKQSLEQSETYTPSPPPSSSSLCSLPIKSPDKHAPSDISSDTLRSSTTRSSTTSSMTSNSTSATTSPTEDPVKSNSTFSALSTTGSLSPSATHSIRIPSSSTQPPAANPSTQESFFKSVHKRLQQLEANSTLSLQYIEEQSRILQDAFYKVEKRQLLKTSTFLETLNTTVLNELRDFRMQYEQIWQSTVLELSSQREESAQEVSVLSARLAFLADEVVFQKRMAMVQFMLILLCFGLVVFSRYAAPSTFFELPPLVQNAFSKSSTNLARYTHFGTPPMSPSSTRPPSTGASSKYGFFRRRTHIRSPSDESDANGRAKSPSIEYSPPTPESRESHRDRNASPSNPSDDESDSLSFAYPMPGHDSQEGTNSRPAVPNQEVLQEEPLLSPKPSLAEKGSYRTQTQQVLDSSMT